MGKTKQKVGKEKRGKWRSKPTTPGKAFGQETDWKRRVGQVFAEARRAGIFLFVESGRWTFSSATTGTELVQWWEVSGRWYGRAKGTGQGKANSPFGALREARRVLLILAHGSKVDHREGTIP